MGPPGLLQSCVVDEGVGRRGKRSRKLPIDGIVIQFFSFELGVFLLGVIAYKIGNHLPAARSLSITACAVAVAAIAIHLPEYLVSHRFLFLFMFAAILPMIFELTKDWRFDRFLADNSFPLYLCQWPLALIAWRWPAFWPGMPATFFAIIYACALVVLVERPIERWRHARFRARAGSA